MLWERLVARWEQVSGWLRIAAPWLRWSGLALLLVASGFWLREWRHSRSELHAPAVVTEVEGRLDGDGNVLYFPHLRFRDARGALVLATSPLGSNPPDFHAGENVPVMYTANAPERAQIATKMMVYSVAIKFGVTGTVLFDLSAVLWVLERSSGLGMRMRIDELRNSGFGRGKPGSRRE